MNAKSIYFAVRQSVDQPVSVRAIRNLLAVAVVVAFATCDSKVLILTCGAQ